MDKKFLLVNFITLLRVIGALLLFPIYLKYGFFTLAIIVLVFYLTDSIDGFLARTFKVSTFFGAIFDAISDKLFNFIVLGILIFNNPILSIALLMEIGILLIAIHSSFKGNKSKTSYLGKIKMVILSISVILTLFLYSYDNLILLFNLPNIDTIKIINILSYIIIFTEIITFIDYLRIDIVNTINNKLVKDTVFKTGLKTGAEIKMMMFSHEFYEKNKNRPLDEFVLKNVNKNKL